MNIFTHRKSHLFLFKFNLVMAAINTMLMLTFTPFSLYLTAIFAICMLLNVVAAGGYALLINYQKDKLK
jgi:hypothetical protein